MNTSLQLACVWLYTDGSIWNKHNDFEEHFFSFLCLPFFHFVTDFSCFYIQLSGEQDNSRRANMPSKKTLSGCFIFCSFLLKFKSPIATFPCGAFSLTGWGIFLKKWPNPFLFPQLLPQFDQKCSSLAVQDLNECLSELNIKGRIYDGIYGTIHISQPSERIIHLSRNFAFGAVGVQDMCDEKWQPTYDEYTWGDKRRKRKV